MPTGPKYILACYFDVSDISFALLSLESSEIVFFNFPYAYSSQAFSNRTGESGFNRAVIETFLNEKKIKLSEVEIISAGFMEIPLIDLDTKFSQRFTSLIGEVKDYYPFTVNEFSILTKDAILSYEPCSSRVKKAEEGEGNELANISIYPQIIPTDIPSITTLDKCLSAKVNSIDLKYKDGDKITFSGSRFSRPSSLKYFDWILALDLIRKAGIYEMYLDRKNVIPLFTLISKYRPELPLDPSPYLERIGTYINAPADTECLLNSDVGTGQFFDVKKDSVFVIPTSQDEVFSVSIKNHVLGNIKKPLLGGSVGLVINTTNGSIYSNLKVFNDAVKQLSLCMHQS